jgi:hypothetical protein
MKNLFFSIIATLLCLFSFSQKSDLDLSYYLPESVSYNSDIPTPKSIIGHEVGEWHINHDKLVQYMYALAGSSDRIHIQNRGYTYEGRPLLLLTITSPDNHNDIDRIQKNHLSLSDTPSTIENIDTMPIVVYQGYSIHGNEPSGSNAAIAVAYYLAAAQGSKVETMLKNTIILLDPSYNPDGLQRFAYWANIHRGKNINPDPNDREYSEVWPGGRTNHYWFDLNRDWLPAQLPESQARLKTFHQWYPNILTDHHEMGTNSTFFFQPGIHSRTHPLTPFENQDITSDIAEFHARALNKIGSLYYSEESYDDFYYGKGSTYPDINGGIGILFEQASSRGHAQESVNGVLTFPYSIRNQFTASLSTLEAANTMREELLNYQRSFFLNAMKEAKNSKGRGILFGDENDISKVYHLAEILKRQNIRFNALKKDHVENGVLYKKGSSFIIPLEQKQHRLIKAMFEKRTSFKDSLFYDISAWTFPLAFNLDYSESSPLSIMGEEVSDLIKPDIGPPNYSSYAYLMDWQEYYSPKAVNIMLQKGIRVKVGMSPFKTNNKTYDYGTILIPVQDQNLDPEKLHSFLSSISKSCHVSISGVSTGLNEGIDLGSPQFKIVKRPEIALLVGRGIASYDAGEIWHLLDQRFDILVTKLDVNTMAKKDLSRYTDIIIPNTWGSTLGKKEAEKLKSWVKQGGSLIGYKNAGRWFNTNDLIKIQFKKRKDTARNISFEQRKKFSGAQDIGGAIFNTVLDRSHPVAFGYHRKFLPMFRNSTLFIEPDIDSYNNPIQYTNSPLLSGYISEKNLNDLKNTVPFKISRSGKGRVIYFTDNTNFRAFWYGTNKLLMNAIFFGDKM